MRRGLAQFGSALGLGPRGRGFESLNPDHIGASCISLALIFLKIRVRLCRCSSFSQKRHARLACLLVNTPLCGLLSLPSFCGCAFGTNIFLISALLQPDLHIRRKREAMKGRNLPKIRQKPLFKKKNKKI